MHGCSPSSLPAGSHIVQRGSIASTRSKRNAGTQMDPPTGSSSDGVAKRVRFADAIRVHDNPSAPERVSFQLTTPSGPKVVHIDPSEYVARPLDLVTDPWVTEDASRYIRKFLTYTNDDGNWFPVHRVPPVGSWAVVDENPAVMHRVHRGRPLLVWIVGVVVELCVCSPREAALPRLHVTFEFLRDIDQAQVSAIHDAASSQPLQTSRRLTVKSPSSEDEGIPSHNAVYDARGKFTRHSAMKDISPGRIMSGDIVLAECTIVRTEGGLDTRTVSFVINSLHWLVEKPRSPSIETRRVDEFPGSISID